MSLDTTLKRMHYVAWDNVHHLYWPYARTTLCGEDKVDRPRAYWLKPPVCRECAARMIELELAAAQVA